MVHVSTFGFWVQSEFENISINQSMQVTAGEINAVKGALRILNVDSVLNAHGVGTGQDSTETANPTDSTFVFTDGDTIIVALGGEEIILTGDTTFITETGDTITTDLGQHPPIIIVNGDTTQINDIHTDIDNTDGDNNFEKTRINTKDTTFYLRTKINHTKYYYKTGEILYFEKSIGGTKK